jgi:hypothetical protein
VQHSTGDRGDIALVQARQRRLQIHGQSAANARSQPQDLPLPARARQPARIQRGHRRLPVDGRHYGAISDSLAEFDGYFQEILAVKPRAVPDQQLNSRLPGEQAFRPRTQRCSEVIEARSKARAPSDPWIMK